MRKADEEIELRKYLLGSDLPDSQKEEIETRLLLEQNYLELLLNEEESLIEDFVDQELTVDERQSFERHFLISEERKEKVELISALRSYSQQQSAVTVIAAATAATASPVKKEAKGKRSYRAILQSGILSPAGALTGLVILILISGLIWFWYFRDQSGRQVLAALNKAYENERPLQSRITGFNYAEYNNTRGAGDANNKVDLNERELAKMVALKAATQNQTAANLHTLGRFYLADRDFDAAIKELEQAARLQPQDSGILSDLGTAQLEKSKTYPVAPQDDNVQRRELGSQALETLEQAIAIDPTLLEARFNKAICLQEVLNLQSRAKVAWEEYLKLDKSSPWAEEARRNLQLLEANNQPTRTKEDILKNFFTAYEQNDRQTAWQVVSQNREMITGKLIGQQLAGKFLVTEGEEQAKYLAALKYVGGLEKENDGDPFISNIAQFYSSISAEKLNDLRAAQAAVNQGYEYCLKNKFAEAKAQFQHAVELFTGNGDLEEANLANYWVGYCQFSGKEFDKSEQTFNAVQDFSKAKNYKWLSSQVLTWLSYCKSAGKEYSAALNYNRAAEKLARDTSDLYNEHKTLSQRADIYLRLSDYGQARTSMQKSLQVGDSPDASLRLKWRDYDTMASILFAMKSYHLSAEYEKESLNMALEKLDERTYTFQTYVNLGVISAALEDYNTAFDFFARGRQELEAINNQARKETGAAYTSLQIANVQRQTHNCPEALKNYDEAIVLSEQANSQPYQYAAHRGRLLCYIENKDDAALQAELPVLISIFNDSRSKILEEQQRNSFFSNEQDVYDIVIDYQFDRQKYAEAFDYSEQSRARSLLDLQNSKVKISETESVPEINLSPTVTEPKTLRQIQAEMPENVQLVEYSVLKNRTLIWTITKNDLSVVEAKISAQDLQEKAANFFKLISDSKNPEANTERESAKELYRILISPIQGKLIAGKQLCVIPDKILSRVPFAALVSPDSEKYFLAEYSFFLSPSANVFLSSTKRAAELEQNSAETLLSIGNPAFNQPDFPNLPDLAAAKREAVKISGFYQETAPNNVLLIGQQASKETIKADLPQANVIHFAGHYVVSEQSPLLSGFILAADAQTHQPKDSILANYEIIGEKLSQTKLIVLSACETNAERVYNGEGMIGASRTFLATGVPVVVASKWSVDSDATAELMIKFHNYRKTQGLSTVEALRRAQLEMSEGENSHFQNPYFWAAFVTLGGYANF